jgi:dTDP-4-dehydrorhamnose reductase
MILLLGADGYLGQSFSRELGLRRACFVPLSRETLDYSRFDVLFEYVRRLSPKFIIHAPSDSGASGLGMMNSEEGRLEALQTNAFLPQTIARVCRSTNTAWGHVSSGSIYAGAKLLADGELKVEPELDRPRLLKLFKSNPERFFGFTEEDPPNASFRSPPCTFLGGTKALAEDALRDCPQTYIWRARQPFSEQQDPGNFLFRIQRASRVRDEITSLTHAQDFARACLDLWEANSPFGIYNVVNPGAVSTRKVLEMVQAVLRPERHFRFCNGSDDAAKSDSRRSSCILDGSKLIRAGIRMRPVEQALRAALEHWEVPAANRAQKRRAAVNIIDLESARGYWGRMSPGAAKATAPVG